MIKNHEFFLGCAWLSQMQREHGAKASQKKIRACGGLNAFFKKEAKHWSTKAELTTYL
jgi:hypothetical protein